VGEGAYLGESGEMILQCSQPAAGGLLLGVMQVTQEPQEGGET
jgi:hypothetical protein